jgi:hypothetical protein
MMRLKSSDFQTALFKTLARQCPIIQLRLLLNNYEIMVCLMPCSDQSRLKAIGGPRQMSTLPMG